MLSNAKKKITEKTVCKHCGENCETIIYNSQQDPFCCEGCKLVFSLIEQQGLSCYYDLDQEAGQSQKNKEKRDYSFLKDEQFADSLLDFKNEKLSKVSFYLPTIHCSACIWILEQLYTFNTGIAHSRVDFGKKEVTINFNHQDVSLQQIVELLDNLGYPPEINPSKKHNKKSPYRRIWLQIGVAGFVFGNTMLFSLPEYFGMAIENTNGLTQLFPYLNALLALPVIFYSATDYFKSAAITLKSKKINMDVPISIGIITLAVYSYYEIFIANGLGYIDSLGALVFFLLLGKLYQQKTFDHLRFDREVQAFFPLTVSKVENGKEETVLLKQVLPADIIKIRNGEIIPADSLLLSDYAEIDYSFITGESLPESKQKEELLYAGGRLKGRSILIQVSKRPSQSYLTSLWDDEELKGNNKSNIQSLADRFSSYFTASVMLIASAAFIYWASTGNIHNGLIAFVSVLIIACPCALALASPVTLGNSMRWMGSKGFFVKSSQTIEQLSKINTVVFDKTGTLTYPDKAEITFDGTLPSHQNLARIKTVLNQSKHPLSQMICHWLPFYPELAIEQYKEVAGEGISAKVEDVDIQIGSRKLLKLERETSEIERENSIVHVALGGEFIGTFKIQHIQRTNLDKLFSDLANEYDTHLLSGDNDGEKKKFSKWFSPQNMLFKQLPGRKKDFIKALKEDGEEVMMVGDGINDAGALKESSVGVAITESGSQFSPASDVIMMGNNLPDLGIYMKMAKAAFKIILVGFGISLLYNTLGLYFATRAELSPIVAAILMPISSISVVLYASIATSLKGKSFTKQLNKQ